MDLGEHLPTINHVISGEAREANPHSHHLGLAAPLRGYLRTGDRHLLEPRRWWRGSAMKMLRVGTAAG